MPPKKKKGGGVASIRDCANCGAQEGSVDGSPVHKTCGRCQIPYYCGTGCQKKHWKSGHKQVCIAPEDRKASQQLDSKAAAEGDECCICLEVMNEDKKLILDCGHVFHQECINQLRKMGVRQVCPLCRADLPDDPEKMFSDGCSIYSQLRLDGFLNDNQTWIPEDKKEQTKLNELIGLWEGAAVQGHVNAQLYLGLMFNNGQGVPQSDTLAVKWTRKAADKGDAEAQFYLGVMYYNGKGGLPQSAALAAEWWHKSAYQGDAEAQFNLGNMYENGEGGLPQSDVIARQLYRNAADQGDSVAQFNLGAFYYNGKGGLPQSAALAVEWWHKSALQGLAESQHYLGTMYEEGKGGLPQSDALAVDWYSKAADQGHVMAGKNLLAIYVRTDQDDDIVLGKIGGDDTRDDDVHEVDEEMEIIFGFFQEDARDEAMEQKKDFK